MSRLPLPRTRVFRIALLSAALLAALVPTMTPSASAVVDVDCDDATARRQNAAHNGSACTVLPPYPSQAWSVSLLGSISYPIVADGKIFVATGASSGSGGWLYAINAATGATAWGPVPLNSSYYTSLTYESGRLFISGYDGVITSYNALTGAQRWATRVSTSSSSTGEIVASDGVIYGSASGAVFAVDASTGDRKWTSATIDGYGYNSTVSVDSDGVFVAGGCSTYKLALATGSTVWTYNSGCSSYGGGVVFPTATRVFARPGYGGSVILDKSNGKLVGTYAGTPAFYGTTAYFTHDSSVVAQDISTMAPKFTTRLPATITTSPIVSNGTVYVGAGAAIYAVNGTTGQITWTGVLPSSSGYYYSNSATDIAIGNGLLVVPTGSTLTAFGTFSLTPSVSTTTTTVAPTTTTTTGSTPTAAASETSLTTSTPTAAYGQPISLAATVDAVHGDGTVRFTASGVTIPSCGSVPVQQVGSTNMALCTASALPPGDHVVRAAYSGDDDYASSDASITQTVTQAATLTVAKAFQTKPANGYKQVGFVAAVASKVTGANLAGQPVTFFIGTRTCNAVSDAKGIARCTLSYGSSETVPGKTWASYSGSKRYLSSKAATPVTQL